LFWTIATANRLPDVNTIRVYISPAMPRVERSVLVHYSAEQMFDLVADVEEYPEFLPWCSDSSVVPEHGGGLDASVEIDYRGIRSRFTTRNQMRYPEQIRMTLVDGPFRALEGIWHFHALRPGACKVQLSLHYEFANGLLGRAVAPVFDFIANSMIDSFAQRAERIYGPTE
jgi:ribosome-associated toxin RatA of RatAB toxin-antitoxin module